MMPLAIPQMAVAPREQSAVRGNDSVPGGNHTAFRQMAASKNKNFEASAKTDATIEGRTTTGQKKRAGSGETTKSHVDIVATMLPPADTYAMTCATLHVLSFSTKSVTKSSV
mmetsp:Transcript_3461/g.8235  ORF Transcript_3461/g.8235 Transcript_3461/m.8235 type:complete len:112 (+) Transcript_3461:662-997(+)